MKLDADAMWHEHGGHMADNLLSEVVGDETGDPLMMRDYIGSDLAGGAPRHDWTDLILPVRRGLPMRAFEVVCGALGVPRERLARVVQVPVRTLARRKVFKPDESERILRVGRLVERAQEVLGSEEAARRWMTQPVRALGGAVPLDHADTEPGARAVEDVLGRLEHGVYS
jgi:putative toxin-antitoxin system antitoxin component (TIGR02293 family)